MYSEETGTVEATDGTELTLVVQHVNIDPALAEQIFEMGVETGSWGWKEKVWYCPSEKALQTAQSAARFYYGWSDGSETVRKAPCGGYVYKARYAC